MIHRIGRTSLVAVVCWGALAAAAEAQEFWSSSTPGSARVGIASGKESEGLEALVSVQGRYAVIGGSVDTDFDVGYSDLFKNSLGVQVEGTLLFPLGRKWHLGPYLSVGWDSFDGKTFTDDVGDTITPDKMEMTTILVGVRFIHDLGQHFSWDAHMGFGAAHSSTVDGVVTLSGVPMDARVFKSTTAFAWDLGTRFAYQAGPVVFDAGIGVRVQGAPHNADLDFNSSSIVEFEVEFGVGVRF
jgi:outer membrane autotransporter protein